MPYQIEKNVEIPKLDTGLKPYPLHALEVGDSFIVPYKEKDRVTSAIQRYYKDRGLGRRFSTRSLDEGVRVWRVE